jgi:hypothetical protein
MTDVTRSAEGLVFGLYYGGLLWIAIGLAARLAG